MVLVIAPIVAAGFDILLTAIIKRVILNELSAELRAEVPEEAIINAVLTIPDFGIIVGTVLDLLPAKLVHTNPEVVSFVLMVAEDLSIRGVKNVPKPQKRDKRNRAPLPERKPEQRNRGPELKIGPDDARPSTDENIVRMIEDIMDTTEVSDTMAADEALASKITSETPDAVTAISFSAIQDSGITGLLSGFIQAAAEGRANTSSLSEVAAIGQSQQSEGAGDSGSGSAISIGGQSGSSLAWGSNVIGAAGEGGGIIGVGGGFGVASSEGGEGGTGGLGDVAGEGGATSEAGGDGGEAGAEGGDGSGGSEGSAGGIGGSAGGDLSGGDAGVIAGEGEGDASMSGGGEGEGGGGMDGGSGDSSAGGGAGAGGTGGSGATGGSSSGGGAGGSSGGGGGGGA